MRRFIFVKFTPPAAAILAASTAPALAHSGHGIALTWGLAHPFSGLDHMLAMVAVGLWASQLGRTAFWILPAVFPAVMAGGALMGASAMALPFVETGIVVSIVVLGAAVAFGVNVPLAASASLVGLFALFHGHAHGTELPATGSGVLYGLGFVLATIALHGIGLGIGVLARRGAVMRTAGGAIAVAGLFLLVAP